MTPIVTKVGAPHKQPDSEALILLREAKTAVENTVFDMGQCSKEREFQAETIIAQKTILDQQSQTIRSFYDLLQNNSWWPWASKRHLKNALLDSLVP